MFDRQALIYYTVV